MAGSHFTTAFESSDAARRLANAVSQLQDPQPLFRDIGEYLLRSHDQRWDKAVSADGTPWAPLKPATLRRKARTKPNAGILVLDEHLRRLVVQTSRNSVEIGTPLIYGATHQFGDPDRNITARPFLGLSDADRDEIGDLAADFLKSALG